MNILGGEEFRIPVCAGMNCFIYRNIQERLKVQTPVEQRHAPCDKFELSSRLRRSKEMSLIWFDNGVDATSSVMMVQVFATSLYIEEKIISRICFHIEDRYDI